MKCSKERIKVAQTEGEKQAIFAFRYRVYVEEMGKAYRHADHERRLLTDDLDEKAMLLYAGQKDQIIGTVRINWGADAAATAAFDRAFSLPAFSAFPASVFSFCSRLMVDKARRSSPLAVLLSAAAYRAGRERGTQFNFVHCAPKLSTLFERLGFRRYKEEIQDEEVGRQVPLVLLLEDIEHLQQTRSPFLTEARCRSNQVTTRHWFDQEFMNGTNPAGGQHGKPDYEFVYSNVVDACAT